MLVFILCPYQQLLRLAKTSPPHNPQNGHDRDRRGSDNHEHDNDLVAHCNQWFLVFLT